MKKYIIKGSDMTRIVKAKSEAEATVQHIETYYSSWYGPTLIDGKWEIYSVDGLKINFSVTRA